MQGESMREGGIFDGDMLLVDQAIYPKHGQILVAVVNGDFVCKTLYQRAGLTKQRRVILDIKKPIL
jgi:DNA polymerase V